MHQYNFLFEFLIFISKPLYLASGTTLAGCGCWRESNYFEWVVFQYPDFIFMIHFQIVKSTQSPWIH